MTSDKEDRALLKELGLSPKEIDDEIAKLTLEDAKKDYKKPEPEIKSSDGLDDPLKLLDLLKDAILRKPNVDKHAASAALRQVMHNYEAQNRVFLIAAANAELPRIVRLLSFIDTCEKELFSDERYMCASTRDLIRLYALSQSHLIHSLDSVKKVADMRLEIMNATSDDGIGGLFDSESKELSALSEISLDSNSRDRVRKVITGLIESIDKDDRTTVVDSDADSD